MTLRHPPIAHSPVGLWQTTCTINVPTYGKDASGYPTVSTTTSTTNVPCSIQPAGSSEALNYGGGVAHLGTETFVGYFPARKADGSSLSIPASATVVADGVTYTAKGAGSSYGDGIQTVPMEVRS